MRMMTGYRDKVAVITGAANGLGSALAAGLAGRKCHLALIDTDEVGLASIRDTLAPSGVAVTIHRADVGSEAAIQGVAREIENAHGKVHLVINNAAVSASASFANLAGTEFERIMRVNFHGVVYVCRVFVPFLQRHKEGQILNVGSCFAWLGYPGKTAYASSKGAVRSFSESLRLELADSGVGVTVLYPGPLNTGLVQNGFCDSEERRNREVRHLRRRGLRLERVVRLCLDRLLSNPARIVVGLDYLMLDGLIRLSPRLASRIMAVAAARAGF